MGFSPDNSTFAAIDIGSHTVRLLLAELDNAGSLAPLRREHRITRLARSFVPEQTLKEDSIRDSLSALREYRSLIDAAGAASITCGATGVIRRSANQREFIEAVFDAAGIEVAILSEDEEAFISAKGMLSVLPDPGGPVLAFDLGGSSTEFLLIDGKNPAPVWCTSVFIGAATITERFFPSAPAGASDLDQAASAVREALNPALSHAMNLLGRPTSSGAAPSGTALIVGGAGTVTTLAAILLGMTRYEPHRVNGVLLERGWLEDLTGRLAGMPLEARLAMPGLENGREDIILGGALIVKEILDGMGRDRLVATDGGLLEGLLLSGVEKEKGLPSSLFTPCKWKLGPRAGEEK